MNSPEFTSTNPKRPITAFETVKQVCLKPIVVPGQTSLGTTSELSSNTVTGSKSDIVLTRNTVQALSKPITRAKVELLLNSFHANIQWMQEPSQFLTYIPDDLTDTIKYQLYKTSANPSFEKWGWREAVSKGTVHPLDFLTLLLKTFGTRIPSSTSKTLLAHSMAISLDMKDILSSDPLIDWANKWDNVFEEEAQRLGVVKSAVFQSPEQLQDTVNNQLKKFKASPYKAVQYTEEPYREVYYGKPPSSFVEFIKRLMDQNRPP